MSVLVRRAWHAVGMARTAEALLVGAGLGLVTLAAAVHGGRGLGDPLAWGAASAAALAMGAAWFLDLRPRADAIARQIDAALRLDGALVTAWECEERGPSALGRMLSQEVRARVRPTAAVAAALPRSAPVLAVPFLGAALLAWTFDQRVDDVREVSVAPALASLARGLEQADRDAQAGLAAGRLDAASVRELGGLLREARQLQAAGARPAGAEDREHMAERLERLGEGLAGLEERLADDADLRRALDRAGAAAEAARSGLDPAGADRSEADDARPSGGPAGPTSEAAGPPGAETAAGAEDAGSLGTPPAADGTMSAASTGEQPSAEPSTTTPPTAEGPGFGVSGAAGGVALPLRWPARHADLAARWVERGRARAAEADPTTSKARD